MLYMGFTAWFEGVEVGARSCAGTRSAEHWIDIATFDFEISYELGHISRMPLPDEIVFQFDLL